MNNRKNVSRRIDDIAIHNQVFHAGLCLLVIIVLRSLLGQIAAVQIAECFLIISLIMIIFNIITGKTKP